MQNLIVCSFNRFFLTLQSKEKMTEDYIEEYFNEVSTEITAVCCTVHSCASEDFSGLEIGKTYHVTHIGVQRSMTNIMLKEFANREFNSTCFDIFENGVSINENYTRDPRFIAPYLRRMYRRLPGFLESLCLPG